MCIINKNESLISFLKNKTKSQQYIKQEYFISTQPKTTQKSPFTQSYKENLTTNPWKFSNLNKNHKFWNKKLKIYKREFFFSHLFFLLHLLHSISYSSSSSFVSFSFLFHTLNNSITTFKSKLAQENPCLLPIKNHCRARHAKQTNGCVPAFQASPWLHTTIPSKPAAIPSKLIATRGLAKHTMIRVNGCWWFQRLVWFRV